MTDAPGSRRTAAWVVGVSVLLGLGVVYWYREVFGPLLLALAFAYILEPVVVRLERRGRSRLTAVALVYGVGGLAMLAVAVLAVSQAFHLVDWLTDPEDGLVNKALDALQKLREEHEAELQKIAFPERFTTPEFWKPIVAPVADVLAATLTGILSTVTLVGVLLLLPIYQFYLMLELPALWRWIKDHLPARSRERTLAVLAEIHAGMAAFLRGRVVIAVLKGAVTALGLLLVGTPLAIVLGLGAGILSILPFIGPLLGFVVAGAVTVANDPVLMSIVWVTAVFLIAEGFENFVFTPWVMKEGVSLHPLTVLFSIMFWAAALGIFGALIAIPLTLIAKILIRELVLPSVERLAT